MGFDAGDDGEHSRSLMNEPEYIDVYELYQKVGPNEWTLRQFVEARDGWMELTGNEPPIVVMGPPPVEDDWAAEK